jgi:hypothetical protein
MKNYIYNRLRPLLIFPVFLLFGAGSYFTGTDNADLKVNMKDSSITFIKNGVEIMPGETLSCGGLETLDIVFWLPANIQDKYGKVKFYLYLDNKEFKTRDFTINDVKGQMAGKGSWKLIAVTNDKKQHSDFDNTQTEFLDKFYTCKMHADAAYSGYKIKAIAKGYKQTGLDKNGMPKFLKQEIFALGEVYVNTTGQAMKK